MEFNVRPQALPALLLTAAAVLCVHAAAAQVTMPSGATSVDPAR